MTVSPEQLVKEAYALHMRLVERYMVNCHGRWDDAARRALKRYRRRQALLPKKGPKRHRLTLNYPRSRSDIRYS